ncbi:hypothetical protein AB835_04125 [Candidatus Endobugula sertula]|uniref:Glycosyl transferase family 2 n=1 Tax=Candidatus Endobugula sertula TaxID=62101 RepID=A0A1D2QRY3_9GAMM|nr:hypothetical protein AB835_04125 [Candidatus Endobugula sertula]
MNIKLICHVKNSFEYLPSFLAYHEDLFDEIHIIDQCSDKDLRGLNNKNSHIFFYKTAYSFFNAMIATTAILEFKNIRHNSDFIFILDIDEFLPFAQRTSFEHFLKEHNKNDAIRFQWCNGLHFLPEGKEDFFLHESSDVRFFNKKSTTSKLAYNSHKTPWFLPLHGNHNAKFHFAKFALLRKRSQISESYLPLYHIPFTSKKNLIEKVKNFDKDEFLEKIINRHQITKNIFQRLTNNEATEDDLSFFAANYRTIGREEVIEAHAGHFQKKMFFQGLQEKISHWISHLNECTEVKTHPSPDTHKDQALKVLGKKTVGGRFFLYQLIKKNIFIDVENVIRFK